MASSKKTLTASEKREQYVGRLIPLVTRPSRLEDQQARLAVKLDGDGDAKIGQRARAVRAHEKARTAAKWADRCDGFVALTEASLAGLKGKVAEAMAKIEEFKAAHAEEKDVTKKETQRHMDRQEAKKRARAIKAAHKLGISGDEISEYAAAAAAA